jgi:DNA-directed RNA polymerase subunit RPC12/RpoP
MEKLKKCSKCGRELPVSEFWKNASTEDGLQTYCKECGNVYARNRKKTPGGGNLKKIYSNIPILNWQNFLHGNLSQN